MRMRNKSLFAFLVCLALLPSRVPAQEITGAVGTLFTDTSVDLTTLGDSVLAQQANASLAANSYVSGNLTSAELQSALASVYGPGFKGVSSLLSQVGDDFVTANKAGFKAGFKTFVEAFTTFYGQAVAFTPHLSYPVGFDNMGGFPSAYLGFGAGMGFSNVNEVKNASSPEAQTVFQNLEAIPAMGMSINGGVGLSERWDLRVSVFPGRTIMLPSSEAQLQNYDSLFTYTAFKLKSTYNLWDGKPGFPGLSLSGFFSYSKGSINIQTKEAFTDSVSASKNTTDGYTSIDYQLDAKTAYNIELDSSWQYYSIGPEVRIWYNLLFFAPYVGYGMGVQFGKLTTALNFNGAFHTTETVNTVIIPTGERFVTSKSGKVPFQSSIVKEAKAPLILHRFFIGAEIRLLLATLAVELQVDPIHQLTGAGAGVALKF